MGSVKTATICYDFCYDWFVRGGYRAGKSSKNREVAFCAGSIPVSRHLHHLRIQRGPVKIKALRNQGFFFFYV